jgi:hypothetical protein
MELSYIRIDDRLDAVQFAQLRAPEWVQQDFHEKFMMSWIYHELGLEGVILGPDELRRALSGCEGLHYTDSELLRRIRRYRDAVRRLRLASARRDRITRGTLLEYQAILCGHQSGDPIRKDPGATEQYKHDVVLPEEIEPALKAVLAEIRHKSLTTHPIELAIDAHYKLVKIWPFEEHSAAVARLVANQILYTHGYPPALIHAHDRQRYYHALHYDSSRLHDLVMEALRAQLETRERVFQGHAAAEGARLAS